VARILFCKFQSLLPTVSYSAGIDLILHFADLGFFAMAVATVLTEYRQFKLATDPAVPCRDMCLSYSGFLGGFYQNTKTEKRKTLIC
jgi:hypothetical protein